MVEDQKFIVVDVVDSGKGISHDICVNLMKPFYTTKVAGKGTGLGLSISKGIIESHNGSFYYDSQSPNTKFAFKIPLPV